MKRICLTNILNFVLLRKLLVFLPRGEININWPTATNQKKQDELHSFDFMIATCPKQNIDKYPDASAIKVAIANDSRNYFYNNISNGITTFQDREIMNS